MQRKTAAIISLVSGLALATGAAAQHGGGRGGGMGGGMRGGPAMGSSMSGSARGGIGSSDFGVMTRDASRLNSQGADHAADIARERANANSAIASGTNASALVGLTTGMTVKDSSGMVLGTVSKIERSHGGTVRNVLVASANGERRILRLAPSSLTVSGNVVTTTTTSRMTR